MLILDVLVYIFGLILLGWIAKKLGLLNETLIRLINDYVYYIGIPVITFLSLHDVDPKVLLDPWIYILNVLPIAATIAIAFILAKAMKIEKAILPIFVIGAFFGNTGYIGFPLNTIVQGKESLYMAAFISTIYTIIALTFGIYLLKRYSGKEKANFKLLKTPFIWAAVLGIVLSPVFIPELVRLPLGLISDSTSPLALFITGAMIGGANIAKYWKEIGAVSVIKLLILPAIVLCLALFMTQPYLMETTSILQAAVPVGVTTTVLAVKFNMDKTYASSAVVVSTALSALTLTLVLLIL